MGFAAGNGIILQDQWDDWKVFIWLLVAGAAILLVSIAIHAMSSMGWDGAAGVTLRLLMLGMVVAIMFLSLGTDAAKTNEGALNSSYGVSDVRLGGGGSIDGLMARPKDGSWQVTYRDSKGGRRTGRLEIAGSSSGSPTLSMTDDSGRPVHPRT